MPWAVTNFSAASDNGSRYLADLPILASNNQTRLATLAQWRRSSVLSSGQDDTDPDYPASWSYDGQHHLITRPRSWFTDTDISLLYDFGSGGISFDVACILQHNANAIPTPGNAVLIEIADDTAFTTRLQTIATWSSNLTRRLVSATLGAGLDVNVTVAGRYTSVRYLRVRYTTSGSAFLPELGELMLLSRYAFPYRIDHMDFDPELSQSHVDKAYSESGRIVQANRAYGQRIVELNMSGMDSATTQMLRDAYTGSRGGRDRMLWIENPLNDIRDALVVQPENESLSILETDGTNRSVSWTLEEMPPYYHREAA